MPSTIEEDNRRIAKNTMAFFKESGVIRRDGYDKGGCWVVIQ